MNPNLAAIVRIKNMALAAASAGRQDVPHRGEAEEAVAAYGRLRSEARKLTERAGWSVDEFDSEIPALVESDVPPASNPGFYAVGDGIRARVLLGQLAAWAAGYQEAFEIEARLEAKAQRGLCGRGVRGRVRPCQRQCAANGTCANLGRRVALNEVGAMLRGRGAERHS